MPKRLYEIGNPKPIILDEKISYRELPDNNYLHFPDFSEGTYEKKPIPVGYRPPTFRLAAVNNVTLVGFRTYLTEDGRLFNDSTFLDGYDQRKATARFLAGAEQVLSREVDGFFEVTQSDALKVIEEPVISLAGDEPGNFGSWLYRILPKLIDVDMRERLPVILPVDHAPWMRALFRTIFGDRVRLIHRNTNEQYSLKTALIPSMRNVGVFFDDKTVEFYRDAAERISGTSPLERIYLSRQAKARRNPAFRPILNEDEFIERLAEKGVVAVDIEAMHIEDQIRTIRDAKLIVAPGGSGLFGCVFASNADFVLDCEPSREWIYAHHSLLRSNRLPHTICFGSKQDGSSTHASWSININAAMKALP